MDKEPVGRQYGRIAFPSNDGLTITADHYPSSRSRGLILLCHQARCNRAEYRETAPRLVALGFTCVAIDQRSGANDLGEVNETAKAAKARGLPCDYPDAKGDIEAAVTYCFDRNGKKPIILVGSSYSASLALMCAVNNKMVGAVIAFSPGEYIRGVTVQEEIRNLKKPIFVTSARVESPDVGAVVRLVDKKYVTHYVPTVAGVHGSRTLWKATAGSGNYWNELEKFLDATQIRS